MVRDRKRRVIIFFVRYKIVFLLDYLIEDFEVVFVLVVFEDIDVEELKDYYEVVRSVDKK